jgi:cytochrome c-type biogenesis protein CcmF
MLANLSVFALVLSLGASLMLFVLPLLSCRNQQQSVFSITVEKYYVTLQWIASAFAFIGLDVCFLLDDFRLDYVAAHSSSSLPWFYKACALWGGHEGSMLLWLCMLHTWILIASWTSSSSSFDVKLREKMFCILGCVSAGLNLFILLTSNPFLMHFSQGTLTGRDLNPLLQDPGFLFHPPMLYVGYVGSAINFALAMAMLWEGSWDAAALRWGRPYLLVSWMALTLGIVLGSWWAYRELGWGGYWFWDPVENASFMPWLVMTALIHTLWVAMKRHSLVAWVILLSILAFCLSLIGTFLVRSGVLTSVHAFAVDPQRGLYILGMLTLTMGAGLILFACRAHKVVAEQPVFWLSKDMMMVLNNVFLIAAMASILLGTLYPLIMEGLGLGKMSVGAPYFNTIFTQLMFPMMALMGIGVFSRHGPEQPSWLRNLFILSTLICILSVMVVFYWNPKMVILVLGCMLSAWVMVMTCVYALKKYTDRGYLSMNAWALILSHLGVGVTALGITVSSGLGQQRDLVMQAGDSIDFAGYRWTMVEEQALKGENYHGVRVKMQIKGPSHISKTLYPEKRIYDVGQVPMTDAAIDVSPWRDLYVALGEPYDQQRWGIRLYIKPLIRWIWAGGLMMVLGGLLACVGALRKRTKA